MRLKRNCRAVLACVLLLALGAATAAHAEDPVSTARSLAFSGKQHRDEALALLQKRVAEVPDDNEARVFYGIVLSWQGRYDEARAQLSEVLAQRPDHGDALPALINVELWSNHPDRAEQLAREALQRHPDQVDLMLAQARALRNLNRFRDSATVLDRVLQLDRHNQAARRMRRSLVEDSGWQATVNHTYDWFSDGRDGQHETSASLRAPTPFGSVTGTINRADRFSLTSYQSELELYPHFRAGTYGYLEVGYSADANLYPTYRVGADLFQSVGHGYELSGGYRHLAFADGINIYTFALAKYYGNWLFTGRGFVTPGDPGTSGTALFSARRFLGSEGQHDFLEFRYSHGASPALAQTLQDIEVLNSSRFVAQIDKVLHDHWAIAFTGGIGQEQRVALSHLRRYTVQGSLYYRF